MNDHSRWFALPLSLLSLAIDQPLGSTRHQGIETEVFWTPAALPDLDLHAGYAYLDSEQRSGTFKGNEVPFAAAHQLTVDARYRFADAWIYTLDGLYVSSAYTDAATRMKRMPTPRSANCPPPGCGTPPWSASSSSGTAAC